MSIVSHIFLIINNYVYSLCKGDKHYYVSKLIFILHYLKYICNNDSHNM